MRKPGNSHVVNTGTDSVFWTCLLSSKNEKYINGCCVQYHSNRQKLNILLTFYFRLVKVQKTKEGQRRELNTLTKMITPLFMIKIINSNGFKILRILATLPISTTAN